MSALRVEIVTITSITTHPNADRLDVANVAGWQVVVGRGQYAAGDVAVYFPIDSVLSPEVEKALFGENSKIKLHHHRVKTIKIRGVVSQGLLGSLDDLGIIGEAGDDVAELLEVTKYTPPVAPFQQRTSPKAKQRTPSVNRHFPKFTDIENVKWWPILFADGEEVCITEKIHGTNFRAGWVRVDADSVWKKIKRAFGFLPLYEFVYGSRNVQLAGDGHSYYGQDIYKEAAEKYALKALLKPGQVVYGEIYGAGVQKNYTYGCEDRRLVIFDLLEDGMYQSSLKVTLFCIEKQLPRCPVLYAGPYSEAVLYDCTVGASVLGEQAVREGCVVRSRSGQRKILKSINSEYLLRDQSDFQ